MDRKGRSIGDLLSTITVAVLFLVIILLVVFAAQSYRHGTDKQQENDNSRAVLAYVASAVKDSVTSDITPENFGDASGLTISDTNSEYERKIYIKDGKLLEEYARKGREISSDDALKIGKLKIFEVRYIDDDLLEIRTDLGTSYVRTKK